ncbi:unnamed protein product, partial [Ectocarpus sp. 6 AP-2014]
MGLETMATRCPMCLAWTCTAMPLPVRAPMGSSSRHPRALPVLYSQEPAPALCAPHARNPLKRRFPTALHAWPVDRAPPGLRTEGPSAPASMVLLETYQGGDYMTEKACQSCAAGTFVFEEASTEAGVSYAADPLSCQACPDDNMSFGLDGQCSCNDGYTIVGASALGPLRCVVTSHVTAIAAWRGSSASTVTYRSLITAVQSTLPPSETLTSLTLEHLFTWAGASCYSYTGSGGDGLQACQSLGNLCALQLHDPSSMACSLFSAVLNNRLGNNHGQTGWGVTLPWLTYIEEASDVRDGTDIEMQLTFASEMRIILAKYSLDGTWLGMEEMSTQPYYCGVGAPDTSAGGGQSRSSKYLKFGHSMTETFECDLKSLLGEEAFFYDPYIVDEA